MNKPVSVTYQGRTIWTAPKGRRVEYLAWAAQGPVTNEMLSDGMAREFDTRLSTNSLSNFLTALVREGRLVRLQRGMFVHVDHAAIFE